MEVSTTAKYLGPWMGPGARDKVWSSAFGKYKKRCKELAGTGAAVVESARDYNATCVTVLGYLPMLHQIPKEILQYERYALAMVFHLPCSTLGLCEALDLEAFGAHSPRSVRALAGSAAIRTTWRFRDIWQPFLPC